MDTSKHPLVTIILACYNQAQYVCETLESIREQTYKTTELVIVDDCSTDNSVTVINDWLRANHIECTFIRHRENLGICKSLNDALAASRGKYISAIAADDVWFPHKIEWQIGLMQSQPESVGVVYSDAQMFDAYGWRQPRSFIGTYRQFKDMPQGNILNELLNGNFIPGMATLVRRSCYERVGTYDEELPWEDWDMWLRIARTYSFVYSPIPSAKYRVHDQSYSSADPMRLCRESCRIALKHLHMGDLSPEQRRTLTTLLFAASVQLYEANDKAAAADVSQKVWQLAESRNALLMHWFAKSNLPFSYWYAVSRGPMGIFTAIRQTVLRRLRRDSQPG